jgi:hypothetical protein
LKLRRQSAQQAVNRCGHFVGVGFEGEVAAVEEFDDGVRVVAAIGFGAGRGQLNEHPVSHLDHPKPRRILQWQRSG